MKLRWFIPNKIHICLISISLAVGFIHIFPHILFISTSDYKGIFLMVSPDEPYYTSRIREVYDGHYKISSPALFEYKNLPFMKSPLPELIVGFIGRSLNLKIDQLCILADFVFPAMITFLLVLLIYRLTSSLLCSILGTLLYILGFDEVSLFYVSFTFDFHRPINPQVCMTVFLMALNFYYICQEKRKPLLILLTGILGGFLIYIHPFYFSFFMTNLFVSLLIFLIRKDKVSSVITLWVLLGSMMVSISYLYFLLQAQNCVYFKDTCSLVGLIKSYRPCISPSFFAIAGIVSGIVLYKLFKIKNLMVPMSFFISGLILANQQCITGLYLFAGHFFMFILLGISFLIAISVANFNKKILKIVFFIITLCVVVEDIYALYKKSIKETYVFRQYQELREVFNWINKNVKKDSVILASEELSLLILIHTHCNVYYPPYLGYFLLPEDAYEDRLLRTFYFYKFPIDKIEEQIKLDHRKFFADKYFYTYERRQLWHRIAKYLGTKDKVSTDTDLPYPITKIKELVNTYKNFHQQNAFDAISKYRIDYVIVSPYERKQFGDIKLPLYPFLKKIYQYKDIYLFSVEGCWKNSDV